MPLKGNLRDFSTSNLLNLINLAKKTGTLLIDGPNQSAQMSFRNGKLIYAAMGHEDGHLVAVLRKAGRLTEEQVRVLRARAPNATDKELGLLLINAGYVSQGDILNSLRHHMLEIVYRLFTWAEGLFRFDPTLMPGDDKITVPIELENVIIEGSRRMQEWAHLVEELPNLDMALKWAERPNAANIRNMSLSADEWRVVTYISPKNSMRAMAKALGMSDMEIRKICYGLLQAGLVELVRPPGMEMRQPASQPQRPTGSAPRPLPPPPDPKKQINIVTKLIARIRSL
ncbi:MAG: DUF4388 domain-containing protein [Anaerolineales bacterium]|nr:DUF4388 domain-containing protein [Anaerolineales bacterium]